MVTTFFHNTEFDSFFLPTPPCQIFTVIFVCIYLRAFLKKQKHKSRIDFFKNKNKTKQNKSKREAFSKLQNF